MQSQNLQEARAKGQRLLQSAADITP